MKRLQGAKFNNLIVKSMKTFEERFSEFYGNLYESQIFALVRRYHENNCSEYPYTMDEFNEVMQGYTPHDIALHTNVSRSQFDANHKYFSFDGQANLVSSDNPAEWTDYDHMLKWYEWHDWLLLEIDADEWNATEEEEEEEC